MAVAGTYKTSSNTPMGKQESTLTLIVDGDSLSGSSASPMGTTEFSGGKVDGDNFEFEMNVKSPMGDMKLTFVGTVSGDNISGTVKSQFGDMPFTGARA
jgi:hypothetical protein